MYLPDPYTSEEAKKHAEEVLEAAGIRERRDGDTDEEHETRVLAGYKAALHSMSLVTWGGNAADQTLKDPRVSKEAKDHAREYLKDHGVDME